MDFTRAGAGDNDWRIARHIACAAADFQAIDARQHQIEDQRVPTSLFQHCHALIAIGRVADVIAFIAQMQLQQFGDMAVVFDDQDSFCLFHFLYRS
ncbi:hypothetical protein D3C81_1922990 [compost metagenome]